MHSELLTSISILLSVSRLSLATVCPKYCDQCPTYVKSCVANDPINAVTWVTSSCTEDCGTGGNNNGYYLCKNNGGCDTDPNPHPTPAPSGGTVSSYTAGWGGLTLYARKDNGINEMYVAIWDAAKPPALVGRGWANLLPGTSADFPSRLPAKVIVSKPKGAIPDTPWTIQYNGQNFTTQDTKYCADGQGTYDESYQRTTNCGFTIEGEAGMPYLAGTNTPFH